MRGRFNLGLLAVLSLLAVITTTVSARALTITPSFGSSITSLPSAQQNNIRGAIASAIATMENLYSNPVTIPIQFSYASTGPSSCSAFALECSNGGAACATFSCSGSPPFNTYSNYVAALTADSVANPENTTLATAIANLPFGNNANGKGQMAITLPQALMLSQYGSSIQAPSVASFTPTLNINPAISFSYTRPVPSNKFDVIGGIEHELDEILGGGGAGSGLNTLYTNTNGGTQSCSSGGFSVFCGTFAGLDLYRYSASKTPSYTISGSATSYFSINGGVTKIVNFEQNPPSSISKWGGVGDFGDFVPDGTGNGELIQNAFNVTGQYENYTSASPEFTMMKALGWDPTPQCNVECYNTFPSKPKKDATSFTVVLAGDLTSRINTSETAIDALVNPFAYVNQTFFGGAGISSATVTFNGKDTLITYSGTSPILPSYTYSYGSDPHVGFEGTDAVGEPPIQLVGEYWGYSDGSLDQQPVLGINCTGGGPDFLVFFSDVTVGRETTGEWNECSGSGVTLSNPTAFDELLSNAGFYLSDSSIPLDSLNFGTFPPPGQPGSVFTDLPGLDGYQLSAGASHGVGVPEPSSLAVLAAGLAGLVTRFGAPRRLRRVRLDSRLQDTSL